MPQPHLTLQESEYRYRDLLEQAAEGVCLTDEGLRLLLVNQAFCDMFGYTREEFLTMTMADLVLAQDLERLASQLAGVLEGKTVYSEQRLRHKDGSGVLVEGSGKMMRDGTIQVVLRDISERKKSEEKLQQTEAFYRAITEQSNEGVMVFDESMTILYRNPSQLHQEFFPYEDMIGQNRTDLIHPDDLGAFKLELPHLRPGQTLLNTFRLKTPEGGWEWFESRVTNLLDHPAVRGYVSNYSNINERKEAEARQRELSQRLLEIQEEERRKLARELHDEIGQSLTAVKVSLQSAQRFSRPGFSKPEAVSNALTITEQLLSQVRELSLSLHPGLLEDLGLVAAVRWYALQHAERSGLTIALELELEEAGLSRDLKLTLYRVVQEGLTNIARHSQAKTVTVSLLEQDSTVVLRIKDDGVGFEASHSTGASLGLLGMRERVTLQGGRFQVKSSPGSGTELYASFAVGV